MRVAAIPFQRPGLHVVGKVVVQVAQDAFAVGLLAHRECDLDTPEEIALVTFMGEQMGGVIARSRVMDENARLQEEALDIRRQLETRKLVERAKGILQTKYNLTEEEAYLRLRGESRRLRRPMRDLAEAIILAEDVIAGGIPQPLRELDLGEGAPQLAS